VYKRLFQLCAGFARFVFRETLRAVVTGVIFTACLWGALSYMGLPVPDVSGLLEKLESVSELSKLLS
jgi:hypothetical protein